MTEVVADSVQFLESKGDSNSSHRQSSQQPNQSKQTPRNQSQLWAVE